MVDRLDHVRSQLARLRIIAAFLLSAALVLGGGCRDSAANSRSPAPSQSQGGSSVGIDSALTLFRAGLEPASELTDASPSIDSLLQRFARMLEERDTAAMRSMVMNRREYAFLYYPTSPYTKAPTIQEPGLNWFLHLQNSQKGATRLLERYGGRPLQLTNSCTGPARVEGENLLWDDCVQRLVQGTETTVLRMFGGIYERGGRFKIFSYSNDL